ncbi:hypothetical protein JK202_07365 [Gluconobacter sp. Dm-62]|uniref:hypothetical protein n=1 Tax=Gluconobacter sp. Dm-62 TaxID=2799804 RepID=UPI001B8CFF39|nr:hypothetical protein [Gluconobacter sp. Dm-62]MBS1102839.1 hypothetical protein [Gluconobacter sp. Dm-62]
MAAAPTDENWYRAAALGLEIKALDTAQPLTAQKVSEILGMSLKCDDHSRVSTDPGDTNALLTDIDFRFYNNKSSVLILNINKKFCITPNMLEKQFGLGHATLSCSHSISCAALLFRGRWRHVIVSMPEQIQDQSCVPSITINSDWGK